MSEDGNYAADTGHAAAIVRAKTQWKRNVITGISPDRFIEVHLGLFLVLYLRTDAYFDMVARWLRNGYAVKLADGIILAAQTDADALIDLQTRGRA